MSEERYVQWSHFLTVVGISLTAMLTIGGTVVALLVNGIDRNKTELRGDLDASNRQLERQIDSNTDRMNAWVKGGFLPDMEGTEDGNRNESP